jgi:hypothetical protein
MTMGAEEWRRLGGLVLDLTLSLALAHLITRFVLLILNP